MTVNVTKPAINVREKLAELDKPTGIAGEAMLRAETPQEQFNLIGAGRRNMLINGDFQVSQRGDFTTATAVTNGGYYLDRWKAYESGVAATIQQTDVTANGLSKKAAKVSSTTSATGYIGIYQKIELQNIPVGATVTASAWVRSTNPHTRFYQEGFGGLSSSYSNTFSNTGEWEYVTWTFETSGTTTSTPIISILTWDGSTVPVSSTDYVEVTMFQLELGKVATPFEHRSYGEELALCQRYYYRLSGDTGDDRTIGVGFASATNDADIYVQYPVELRDIPSTTVGADIDEASFKISTASAGTDSSLNSIIDPTRQSARLRFRADSGSPFTAGEGCMGRLDNLSSAYIEFDAEL
jgi:hypothetical protein